MTDGIARALRASRLASPLPAGLALGLALAAAATGPAGADPDVSVNVHVGLPPPVTLAVPPPLVLVPGLPRVSYAPSVSLDIFRVDRHWYYLHGGHWFVGPSHRGPWKIVAVGGLPAPLLAVPVGYYKVPPGHLKHHGGPPGRGKAKGKGHRR
jgi:hypothetical protein